MYEGTFSDVAAKICFGVATLKAPYSSKIDIIFVQGRFNKLIYSNNTIIKFGI